MQGYLSIITVAELAAGQMRQSVERNRAGKACTTGFAASTINQVVSTRFCMRQQMPWSTRGAYLLQYMRVRTLNRALGSVLKR